MAVGITVMRQEFFKKFQNSYTSQEKLKSLMAEIDSEKRSLKSFLSRVSSEPDGKFGKGRLRQVTIRKAKDKIAFLSEEREAVRKRLGDIKMDKKALNRVSSERSVDFCHAFMAAAERLLPEDVFLEVEYKASDMMLHTK